MHMQKVSFAQHHNGISSAHRQLQQQLHECRLISSCCVDYLCRGQALIGLGPEVVLRGAEVQLSGADVLEEYILMEPS